MILPPAGSAGGVYMRIEEIQISLFLNFCRGLSSKGVSGRGLSGNGGESSVKIGGTGKTALLRNFQFTQGGGSQQTDGQLYPFDGDILPWRDTVEFFEQGRKVGGSQVGHISKFF